MLSIYIEVVFAETTKCAPAKHQTTLSPCPLSLAEAGKEWLLRGNDGMEKNVRTSRDFPYLGWTM